MAPISQPRRQRAASVGAKEEKQIYNNNNNNNNNNNPEKGEQKQIDSPDHPIAELQGPFDESILESVQQTDKEWVVDVDAQARRRSLLEDDEYERLCGRRWRQRPGEKFHPFWKLIAQLSFGVHLLVKGLAKSDAEVAKILQSHVDEMDGFLERTSEDFLIIQLDLRTRIQYLTVPLQNPEVFDSMLADRKFRHSMIQYNDTIEHAVGRFSTAVRDALKDVYKGKEAIRALWHYLAKSATDNTPLPVEMQAIYDAMAANIEGWNVAFSRLRKRGTALESALGQLGVAVMEMQRRVGVASRKETSSLSSLTPKSRPPTRSLKERLFDKGPSEKPLPQDPGFDKSARTSTSSKGSGGGGGGGRRMMTQKSVPNLRAARASDSSAVTTSKTTATKSSRTSSCARSANETECTRNSGVSSSTGAKTSRSFSRKLSMAVLPKRSASDNSIMTQGRISMASSGILPRSRGASSEQSRSSRAIQETSVPEEPEVPPVPPVPSKTEAAAAAQTPARPSTRQENMKSQIMQYFKTEDQVKDAWEKEEKKGRKLSRRGSFRKDGPRSTFRRRSSISRTTTPERPQTAVIENDLESQMTKLRQEAVLMNTYSLKPQHEQGPPRIHVLSIQSTLPEEPEEENEAEDEYVQEAESVRGDAESIITALPSFPFPPNMASRANRTSIIVG